MCIFILQGSYSSFASTDQEALKQLIENVQDGLVALWRQ